MINAAFICKNNHASDLLVVRVDRNGRRMNICVACRAAAGAKSHVQRIQIHTPPIARMMRALTVLNSGCWVTDHADNGRGYVAIDVSDGRTRRANAYIHRIAYEEFVGPIADGLEIDHKCRNRRCFSPLHLEAVTRSVNILRAVEARRQAPPVLEVDWRENARLLAAWVRRMR